MAKYTCSICNYVYDEEKEKVKFSDLPDSWKCPLCGAVKQEFVKNETAFEDKKIAVKAKSTSNVKKHKDTTHCNAEMSILCSNLAKGCEKQYMQKEAELFTEIADYYSRNSEKAKESDYNALLVRLNDDIKEHFPNSFQAAKEDSDRGSLRALTWTEKVSKIVKSLLTRYQSEGTKFLENTKIFVCEICGFIYLGDQAPDVCPVCKVPKLKIHEVGRA
jgi:rubrerythrin